MPTQQPNFIRLIANTIREVSTHGKENGLPAAMAKLTQSPTGNWLNRFDASQFANIFQSM